jgi:hypothetical protein
MSVQRLPQRREAIRYRCGSAPGNTKALGSLLDFVESDIAAVRDDESGQLLHQRQEIVSR